MVSDSFANDCLSGGCLFECWLKPFHATRLTVGGSGEAHAVRTKPIAVRIEKCLIMPDPLRGNWHEVRRLRLRDVG